MDAGYVILVTEDRVFWHQLHDFFELQHGLEAVLCGYGAAGAENLGLDIWWTIPKVYLIDILINRHNLVIFLNQRILDDHRPYFRCTLDHPIFHLCISRYLPMTLYRMKRYNP